MIADCYHIADDELALDYLHLSSARPPLCLSTSSASLIWRLVAVVVVVVASVVVAELCYKEGENVENYQVEFVRRHN